MPSARYSNVKPPASVPAAPQNIHTVPVQPTRDPVPSRNIGKGTRCCFCCGEADHDFFSCPRKKTGLCGVCSSNAHLSRSCSQRYYPAEPENKAVLRFAPLRFSPKSGSSRHLNGTGNLFSSSSISSWRPVMAWEEKCGHLTTRCPTNTLTGAAPHSEAVRNGTLTYSIRLNGCTATVLVDTGTSHSYIDAGLVHRCKLPQIPLAQSLSVALFTGHPMTVRKECIVNEVYFAGLQRLWKFLILPRAPVEVVRGLDAVMGWEMFIDPRTG